MPDAARTAAGASDPMAAFDLSGRVALVTGARRGIGRAIAEALAARHATVAVHHRGTEDEARDADAVVAGIAARGGRAEAFAADFATRGAAPALARAVVAALGPVDILVLNASIEILQDWHAIDDDAFDRQTRINLHAPLDLLRVLVPPMTDRGWGRVVAIGSIQQHRPHPSMLLYAGTKAAQRNWVANLARQVGRHGVTVNNLAPGAILTDRNADQFADPDTRRHFLDRVPAGRLGTPDDLAGPALLLCSDAGRYINGADLLVDGGLHIA